MYLRRSFYDTARIIYRKLPLSAARKLKLRSFAISKIQSPKQVFLNSNSRSYTSIKEGGKLKPTNSTNVKSVIQYLNRPAYTGSSERWHYSEFMLHVWRSRLDLQKVFNIETELGRMGYVKWYLISARKEYGLTADAYPEYVLDELSRSGDSQIQEIVNQLFAERKSIGGNSGDMTTESLSKKPFGANLIGYARGEFGMGEHVRMVAKSCNLVDVPFSVIDFEEKGFHGKRDNSVSHWISSEQQYPVNIFHINADAYPSLFFHFSLSFFDGHINVGYWAWELENCPEEFDLALNMVDEVWAISEFVRDSFAQRSKVPVVNMPLAVSVPEVGDKYGRSYYGLPEEDFVFLYTFDSASYIDRKNPIAAVKAFKYAFSQKEDNVRLVLKTMNASEKDPLWKALISEIGNDPRINIFQKRMTRQEVVGLNAVCDAFVSLHRSEGFGRCIAESMLLGKPVIVTNYSGSTDFANEYTACAIDYELLPVPEGNYPCWENQVWADPDWKQAAWFMRKLYSDEEYRNYVAIRGQRFIQENYSEAVIGKKYRDRLKKIAAENTDEKLSAMQEQTQVDMIAGEFDGDQILIHLDKPALSDNVKPIVSDVFEISGWAIATSGVSSVTVSVDSNSEQIAHLGILRPDVGALYPDITGSERCGFFCRIDLEKYGDGIRTVEIKLYSSSCIVETIKFEILIDNSESVYNKWLARNVYLADKGRSNRLHEDSLSASPFISIASTGVGVEIEHFILDTLRSLKAQIYTNWELIVDTEVDKNGKVKECAKTLGVTEYIRYVRNKSTNFWGVLETCNNDLVGVIDFGDVLDPRALYAFALAFNNDPNLGLVYADEDEYHDGHRTQPVFKPGWSPTLFENCNYFGRPWFVKKAIFDTALSNLDHTTESSIMSEIVKHDSCIAHIPTVMCSRRRIRQIGDKSIDPQTKKSNSYQGKNGRMFSEDAPLVSIIMPTRLGDRNLVERCLSSVFSKSAYVNFELIVVVNNVVDFESAMEYLNRWPLTVVEYNGVFNWAAINNFGARLASGKYLLFMNDDIEIQGRNWLAAMVHAAIPSQVGVVGATLRYPNGSIQHAGLALNQNCESGITHLFRFFSGRESWLSNLLYLDRECTAVTGACMLTPSDIFNALGGFDEGFPLVCNDSDYCFRVWEGGYRCVVTGDTGLIHHEGISRGGMKESGDIKRFKKKWRELLAQDDPYVNPNLSSTESGSVDPLVVASIIARKNGSMFSIDGGKLN